METDLARQAIIDEEHLSLLVLGYRISAGITALFSLIGIMYVMMGLMFLRLPMDSGSTYSGDMDTEVASLFVGIGLGFMAVFITLAVLKWMTADRLRDRRSLAFCQVIAALTCLEIPYGTALGVLTFIAIGRASVRGLFAPAGFNAPPPPA